MKRLPALLAATSLLCAPAAQGQGQAQTQTQAQAPQSGAPGATAQAATAQAPDPSWPRDYDVGDDRLELYQPQVEGWDGNVMSGRAAVAIGPKAGTPTYGYVHFTANVAVDKYAGVVHLEPITIDRVEVPTAQGKSAEVKAALAAHLPADGLTIPIDQLQASYAVNRQLTGLKAHPVDNAPPRIVFASTLTLLVPVAGEPALRPIDGAPRYRRVINAQAMLLQDQAGGYHLQAAGSWYAATGLGGPWVVVPQPPADLLDAAKTSGVAQDADPMLSQDGKPTTPPPAILVSTVPTELIQTDGQPDMLPVAGTGLLTMGNADHAVFMDPASNAYYVLISGRWFRSADLDGGWTFVASNALPADFATISPQDPKGNVLTSVAGTPQAKEAAIAATIPQTAVVPRSTAASASYDGSPQFQPVAGTPLRYAVNSPQPVIEVGPQSYYMVSQGVWFFAATPAGPWQVATSVPDVIYTIPVTSPVYYATHVRVYAVQPDAVVSGYTPGYLGVLVQPGGTVVYGTGYDYPGYVGSRWYAGPATYGYGAGFSLTTAVGFGFGFAGGWAWGPSVGPHWGAYWGGSPWGRGWGGFNVNEANIYGRWGGGVRVHYSWSYSQRTVEWSSHTWSSTTFRTSYSFHSFSAYSYHYTSEHWSSHSSTRESWSSSHSWDDARGRDNRDVDTRGDNRGADTRGPDAGNRNDFAGRGDGHGGWDGNHVYAGRDGSVYRNDNGDWHQRTGDDWRQVDRSAETRDLDHERAARQQGADRVAHGDYSHYWGDHGGGDRGGDRGGGERGGHPDGGFHGGGGHGGGGHGGGGHGGGHGGGERRR